MSTPTHDQLLAQLQNEVNRVLEQTGRLFAAAAKNKHNNNGKAAAAPVAQIHKLKRVLPESNQKFHKALDQLEDELQMAKLVMRRDLALCRERAGISKPVVADESAAVSAASGQDGTPDHPAEGAELAKDAPIEDVVMEDSQPAETEEAAKPTVEDTTVPDASAQATSEPNEPPASTQDATLTPSASKPAADTGLHIDTHAQPAAPDQTADDDDDKPPDTGTYSNTADLDSLFGGPLSAGPGDESAAGGAAPDFPDETAAPADFDFDTFATSLVDGSAGDNNNDNISALLPGLEDYASAQPTTATTGADESGIGVSGDVDFDDIFGESLGEGEEREGGMGHRDSTFDDLFDLQDFHAGDFGEGNEGDAAQQGGNLGFEDF